MNNHFSLKMVAHLQNQFSLNSSTQISKKLAYTILNLDYVYKQYSKIIPLIGKFIVGQKKPYEYLIESIEKFLNQDELIDLMKKNRFEKCSFRNLSGGIVSIHSGWKI